MTNVKFENSCRQRQRQFWHHPESQNFQGKCLLLLWQADNYQTSIFGRIFSKLGELVPLTLFRMGKEAKRSPTPNSCYYVTSTNVGNLLWLLVSTVLLSSSKIWSLNLLPVPNCLTWTKSTPHKKLFSCQIVVKSRLWYFVS